MLLSNHSHVCLSAGVVKGTFVLVANSWLLFVCKPFETDRRLAERIPHDSLRKEVEKNIKRLEKDAEKLITLRNKRLAHIELDIKLTVTDDLPQIVHDCIMRMGIILNDVWRHYEATEMVFDSIDLDPHPTFLIETLEKGLRND